MYRRLLAFLPLIAVLWLCATSNLVAQQIYKWIDDNGRVHYGSKKPENVLEAQPLDIAPTSSAPSTTLTDPDAEIARIKAASEQMAQERQAIEQARQEQRIRELEQQNQQLQQDLLIQQLEQEQQNKRDNSDNMIIGYPPDYSYYPRPYPPSYSPPYPPQGQRPPPCQPWPDCHRPPPPPHHEQLPKPPLAKPNPPFHPKPIGVDTTPRGVFTGR